MEDEKTVIPPEKPGRLPREFTQDDPMEIPDIPEERPDMTPEQPNQSHKEPDGHMTKDRHIA